MGLFTDFMNWLKPPAIKQAQVIQLAPKPLHSSLTLPQCGIDLIKKVEGCRMEAYKDTRGIPTIGFGHVAGVRMGDTCTYEQAVAWLKFDVTWAWQAICQHVKVPLTSYQAGALLSFCFNLGEPKFIGSTLLRILNAGDYKLVPLHILEWDKENIDGVETVSKGLLNRRNAEVSLWNNNDWRPS